MTDPAAIGQSTSRPKVLIIGSGFGGLFAARALRRAPVDVTLVAKTGHHLFQPLLYQVATGILASGEIAPATREVLAQQKNATVLLGEVTEIDLDAKRVTAYALGNKHVHDYEYLVVAAGAAQSWFGNDQFADHAPGMKDIDDAFELRGRIYDAFELAEIAGAQGRSTDVDRLLTFVVIGGGPTGVEMAGQLSELSRRTLKRDFRNIDPKTARIILLDASPHLLASFDESLQVKARRSLEKLGIEVLLDAKVVDVDEEGIDTEDHSGQRTRIEAATKVWAAGVAASPLARVLADQVGLQVDRQGRIPVQPDLTLPGRPEVFVIGDMATLERLPGVAQVAIQGARYAAKSIRANERGRTLGKPFHYTDKGSMATISRFQAIAEIGRFKLTGFIAWVTWLVVHLVYVVGFKSRLTTLVHWGVSFLGRGRAARAFTEQQVMARRALQHLPSPHLPESAAIEVHVPEGLEHETTVQSVATEQGPHPRTD